MNKEKPGKEEIDKWHRYFAVECNNRAWGLASQSNRTAEECAEMLDAAHTAALHWARIGTDLHVMRAKMLLAEVHALLNMGATALPLAQEVSNFFQGRETDDWEVAFVHTIHAHAAAAIGDAALHATRYQAAETAIESIADDEDREIVMQTFQQVPIPA